MKKNKLLICALFMSMVLSVMPDMKSYAAGESGESAAETELQDENSQRLEAVTAMDEEGDIYEVGETDGTVEEDTSDQSADEEDEESVPENIISLFSVRSAAEVSMKVVNFNTKSNVTTDYTYSGGSGYTNGNYGADAAYLGTDASGNIRFMLAGVTGTVKKSEVQVLDYSEIGDNVSYYQVSGGKLIHYISYNLNQKPKSSINNGPAPSYLNEGTKYYSYDGHYFYKDYKTMLSDYQSGANGASAVNSGNAFYNYFQFLDMNSSTNYSGDELNNILNDKISSSDSKLLNTGTLFVKYQNQYGVNALLSLGIAVNESAWGTSRICMTKNNLFGLNAYDQTPGQSADYFASAEDCIREFMSDWMSDGYLSSSDWRNHGGLLGNKSEGINVSYASDPYWGEKAAAIAWELDAVGGSHDYLGVSSDDSSNEPADTPDPDNASPTDTDTPADAEQPSDVEEPPMSEEPSDADKPSDPEEPSDVVEPSYTDIPVYIEQPLNAEETSGTEDSDIEKPSAVKQENQTASEELTEEDDLLTQPASEEKPSDGVPESTSEKADQKIKGRELLSENTDTDTRVPQTGDEGNPGLWIVLMALSLSVGVTAFMRRKMSR